MSKKFSWGKIEEDVRKKNITERDASTLPCNDGIANTVDAPPTHAYHKNNNPMIY